MDDFEASTYIRERITPRLFVHENRRVRKSRLTTQARGVLWKMKEPLMLAATKGTMDCLPVDVLKSIGEFL